MGTQRFGSVVSKGALGAAFLIFLAAPLHAASFVKVIGGRTRTSPTNSSIDVPVPFSGVAAGNSILVTVHIASAGDISCSDTRNGVYATDVLSDAGGTVRIAIASKHQVAELFSGDIIRCSYPLFAGASSATAVEFSGLATGGPLDQTAQAGSTTAGAASSGLTASTSQADELVFGFFWLSNPAPTQTFVPATSGGNPLENPYAPPYTVLFGAATQKPMYRFVNAVRQYEANGTVAGTGEWKAQIATYRLAPDLCAGVDCDDGSICTLDSCNPATGLCANVPGNAGAVCRNAAGQCDVRERCDGASPVCPADVFAASGTACGDSEETGDCNHADSCDGQGACLNNQLADGAACGEPGSACVNQDTCSSGVCQDNGFVAAGAACGDASNAECDAADTCSGSGACVANVAADGAACGDAGSACVNQDTCAGGACRDNGFVAAGSACGDASSGQCDAADSCDGAGSCQSNAVAAGAPCSDLEECTDEDACDGSGQCAGSRDELCFACRVNVAPVVSAEVDADPGDPTPLGEADFAVTASFADAAWPGHTCTIDWGDGSTPDAGTIAEPFGADPGTCTGFHQYAAVGAHEVTLSVTDECGETSAVVHRYAVVYDPEGGFVTGGGWIESPEGAYAPNPSLAGRAVFGFVARYARGASRPDGHTHFHFHVADFRFDSSAYEWLVISGAKARLRGEGTVNGGGRFEFEVTAWDGDFRDGDGLDRLRIRIWEAPTGVDVYDNQIGASHNADPTTAIGGGNIIVQKK